MNTRWLHRLTYQLAEAIRDVFYTGRHHVRRRDARLVVEIATRLRHERVLSA